MEIKAGLYTVKELLQRASLINITDRRTVTLGGLNLAGFNSDDENLRIPDEATEFTVEVEGQDPKVYTVTK